MISKSVHIAPRNSFVQLFQLGYHAAKLKRVAAYPIRPWGRIRDRVAVIRNCQEIADQFGGFVSTGGGACQPAPYRKTNDVVSENSVRHEPIHDSGEFPNVKKISGRFTRFRNSVSKTGKSRRLHALR